jgi:hypothetical protein
LFRSGILKYCVDDGDPIILGRSHRSFGIRSTLHRSRSLLFTLHSSPILQTAHSLRRYRGPLSCGGVPGHRLPDIHIASSALASQRVRAGRRMHDNPHPDHQNCNPARHCQLPCTGNQLADFVRRPCLRRAGTIALLARPVIPNGRAAQRRGNTHSDKKLITK